MRACALVAGNHIHLCNALADGSPPRIQANGGRIYWVITQVVSVGMRRSVQTKPERQLFLVFHGGVWQSTKHRAYFSALYGNQDSLCRARGTVSEGCAEDRPLQYRRISSSPLLGPNRASPPSPNWLSQGWGRAEPALVAIFGCRRKQAGEVRNGGHLWVYKGVRKKPLPQRLASNGITLDKLDAKGAERVVVLEGVDGTGWPDSPGQQTFPLPQSAHRHFPSFTLSCKRGIVAASSHVEAFFSLNFTRVQLGWWVWCHR